MSASRCSIASGLVFFGRRKQRRGGRAVIAGHEWQMPQGGIDDGESPIEAARRELFEETNVASVLPLAEAPDWLSYDLPPEAAGRALEGALSRTDPAVVRFPFHRRGARNRHRATRRRRFQAGIRGLGAGARWRRAGAGGAVQARGL